MKAYNDGDQSGNPIGMFSQPSDGQLMSCPNGRLPNVTIKFVGPFFYVIVWLINCNVEYRMQ